MIRNLKVLCLAAMALGVFGVINVGSAHAAEELFHCEVQPCRLTTTTDGTEETAHHVFVVKNANKESISFTCDDLTGEATAEGKTEEDITLTNIAYDHCTTVLGTTTVDMNGCDYRFNSKGGGTDAATVTINCPEGKKIEVTASATCTVNVGPQGPLKGIGYHTLGAGGAREVTVTAKVPGIAVTVTGSCGTFKLTPPYTAEYTTGNTIVTAEKDNANKEMVACWWE